MQSPELSGDRNSTRGSGTNLPLPQRPRSRMAGPSCTRHGSGVRPSALHPPRVGIGGRGMVRVLDSVGDGAHNDGNKHGDRQVFHWPFSDVASCVTDRGFTCSTVKTRTGGAVCGRNRSAIRDDLEIKPVSIWMQPFSTDPAKEFPPGYRSGRSRSSALPDRRLTALGQTRSALRLVGVAHKRCSMSPRRGP